jgi:hypothetical protein
MILGHDHLETTGGLRHGSAGGHEHGLVRDGRTWIEHAQQDGK